MAEHERTLRTAQRSYKKDVSLKREEEVNRRRGLPQSKPDRAVISIEEWKERSKMDNERRRTESRPKREESMHDKKQYATKTENRKEHAVARKVREHTVHRPLKQVEVVQKPVVRAATVTKVEAVKCTVTTVENIETQGGACSDQEKQSTRADAGRQHRYEKRNEHEYLLWQVEELQEWVRQQEQKLSDLRAACSCHCRTTPH